ncbi:MAG TPA: tripartite tricarboxylate transporter substrate binding protein [Candidatus Didemnitutus sp.]
MASTIPLLALGAEKTHDFPTRPIRIIIPFPAGGPRDMQARLIGTKLTAVWGHSIIIDNRAGANGIVGTALAAQATPDGYTLLMISAGHAVSATLYPRLPYDSLRDFAPIGRSASAPGIVVVAPAFPARSVPELIDYARARPGKLFYASAGTGSPSHLAVELFKLMTRTDFTHVPYKGMAQGITDLLAGQIQLSMPSIPGGLPLARAGKLRALAVTSARRSPAVPELPTVAETGVPGYSASNWYGFAAPARTPDAIITKLNAEITRAVTAPDTRAHMADIGLEAETSTPAEFGEFIKAEIAKWAKVIKATGLKPE